MNKLTAIFCLGLYLFCFSQNVSAENKTIGFLIGAGGLGDQSFNDMTVAGLSKAKKKYSFNLILEEPANQTKHGVDRAMQALIDHGADFIIANSVAYYDSVKHFAAEYTDKRFLLNSIALPDLPNVVSTVYGDHEGAFLVGALAGWMTKTDKVGFIGGTDFPVIHKFRLGYANGVKYANPKVGVVVRFVVPGRNPAGFSKPDVAFKIAMDLYRKDNVDIIFAAAGLSGNGVIHASNRMNRFSIGVDSDQDHLAKGHVLTSVVKRLDIATYKEVTRYLDGQWSPGVRYYGLKEGGTALSDMKYTKDLIPERILSLLTETRQKVLSGLIRVPNFENQSP